MTNQETKGQTFAREIRNVQEALKELYQIKTQCLTHMTKHYIKDDVEINKLCNKAWDANVMLHHTVCHRINELEATFATMVIETGLELD